MLEPTDRISVALQAQQWNLVLQALHEAPYRVAAPLIAEINRQAQAQHAGEPRPTFHMKGDNNERQERTSITG